MHGAIIGDIVGSKYEFNSLKTKSFPFVSEGCTFTDDTVMTVAVARSLLDSYLDKKSFKNTLVQTMRELGNRYPNAGYGGRMPVTEAGSTHGSTIRIQYPITALATALP